MDATSTFNITAVGQRTGRNYTGKFTVKAVLSRRENFLADERRRYILGANAAGAPASLQGEAFMLGQLFVRIVEGPVWWQQADGGLEIEDENIIGELYKLTEEKVQERETELAASAKTALKTLANSPSKKASSAQKSE